MMGGEAREGKGIVDEETGADGRRFARIYGRRDGCGWHIIRWESSRWEKEVKEVFSREEACSRGDRWDAVQG